MSDTLIPMQGQTAVLDRPVEEAEVDSFGGSSNRGKLFAVLGLAGVLVLGAVAYFLVFAGGQDEAAEAPVPRAAAPVVAPPAAGDAAGAKAKQPRISQRNFGRDPFKALIVEPESVSTTTGTETTSGDATTGTTADSTTGSATGSTTGGSTTGSTTTTTTTTVPPATQSHVFRVVDVAPDNSRITVKVDGKFYRNLKAGEVFAKYFKVVLISGPVNSFQYGDDKFNVAGTKRLTIA